MKMLLRCNVGLTQIWVASPDWSNPDALIAGGWRPHGGKEKTRWLSKHQRDPHQCLREWAEEVIIEMLDHALERVKVGSVPAWLVQADAPPEQPDAEPES